MKRTTFSFPAPIHFGASARRQVAAHLREAGLQRPLVVTARALAALPVMAEFLTHLGGLQAGGFDGVFGNPAHRRRAALLHRPADPAGHRPASWPLQRHQRGRHALEARALQPPAGELAAWQLNLLPH